MKTFRIATVWILALALVVLAADGPRQVKPGFNLFSKEQDIQLGKEAAAEFEKQLPLVTNADVVNYVKRVGDKLTALPDAQGYPYTWRVVQDDSINAFALPGGPMFVHTGLISQAENEAQLAGVLGHEISHIVLRHGTNQASKANFMQLGAMLGGALLGGKGMVGDLAALGINIGLNGVLLRYSRNAERDADVLGMRLMAQAGYNPIEMANFFEKLSAQHGKTNKVEQWFSSHPQPEDRTKVIQEEMRYLPRQNYTVSGTGNLPQAQRLVSGLPKAPQARNQGQGSAPAQGAAEMPRIEHSTRFTSYRGEGFAFSHPDNWQVAGQGQGTVTIVPPGGAVNNAVGYGVITGLTEVQQGETLGSATEAFLKGIQQSNPGVQVRQSPQNTRINHQPAQITELAGPSPYKGQSEYITAITMAHPKRLLFSMVFIYPESDAERARQLARQIVQSVQLR